LIIKGINRTADQVAGKQSMSGKKIVLTTIGTRGDVQPYMALALGLKRAGYRVKLAAPTNFQGWIEGAGLEFAHVVQIQRRSSRRPR